VRRTVTIFLFSVVPFGPGKFPGPAAPFPAIGEGLRAITVFVADHHERRRPTNFGKRRWDRFSVACCARNSALFSVMVGGAAILSAVWGPRVEGDHRDRGRL
jgi:hypothetical protein